MSGPSGNQLVFFSLESSTGSIWTSLHTIFSISCFHITQLVIPLNDHCVNNDFPNTFLAAQMRLITLAGCPEF